MSTGFNGTPMPSFVDALKPEQRWAITDFIVSLSGTDGPGYTNLVVAKHVQDPIDLTKGAASFASARRRRAFRSSGRSWSRDARSIRPRRRVTVQAIYDAESIALLVRWHDMSAEKTGKNGPSLPVPPEEEEEARRAPAAASGSGAAKPFGATKSPRRRQAAGPRRAGSLCRGAEPRQPAPPSEFSDAVAVQIPSQVPTGARKPYFIFGDGAELGGSLVLRSGPARARCSSPAREARTSRPTTPSDLTGVASYDQGEWSVIFKRPLRAGLGRARSRPESSCRSPSRSGTGSRASAATGAVSRSGIPLYVEPEVVPSAVGPMVRTALLILAIELVVIGWVRWRYALSRADGDARAKRRGERNRRSPDA